MLVFAFFRCSTNSSGSTDITFQPVPTLPPTTVAAEQPSDASAAAAGGLQTFRSGDLEVMITGCGPGVITGSVHNIGNATSDFMTEITVEPTESSTVDQPRTITVTQSIAPLQADESQPLIIPFGPELDGVISCNVIDVVSIN